jgi:protein-S-isoprenylcysteine O-methyltransferase Ste14
MEILVGRFVALCWLAFLVVWLVAAFRTKRTVERRRGVGLAWLWPLVVGLLWSSNRQDMGLLTARLWSYTATLGVVAVVITSAGLLIALWARTALGALWSSSVVLKEGHAVVDQGPYRYVRHPIYSGVLLMILGSVMLWGRLIALLLFVLAFTALWIKLRREERLLTTYLSAAYLRYKSRVKSALVPFVL